MKKISRPHRPNRTGAAASGVFSRRLAGAALAAALCVGSVGCGRADAKSSVPPQAASEAPASSSGLAAQKLPTVQGVPAASAASAVAPNSAAAPEAPTTVQITFAEGATVARIADTLEENGVTDSASFFAQVAETDLSAYPLAAEIPPSEGRCFRLEGYLFPDTYEFYVGESAESVLHRMLSNAEARISQTY
ncbi:MAG: endolytic transglycosylase MltG, partial [Oscillospiraceae bacterium]